MIKSKKKTIFFERQCMNSQTGLYAHLTPGWAKIFKLINSWSFELYINQSVLIWAKWHKMKKIHFTLSFLINSDFLTFLQKLGIFEENIW